MLSSGGVGGRGGGGATAITPSGWPSKLLIDLAFTTPSFVLFLLVSVNGGRGDGDGEGFLLSSFSTTVAGEDRLRTLFMLRRRPFPK